MGKKQEFTPLQRYWLTMAQKRSLVVDVPYALQLADGTILTVEARLRGYGAKKGMLIVSDYAILQDRTNEIVGMGYGFSCMPEPTEEEIQSDEGLDKILDDWGLTY